MCKVPITLRYMTEQLAQAIRQSDVPTQDSVMHYHQSVRDNIDGVMAQSFPLFNACLPPDLKTQLINEFLVKHGALAPEFHQIATELVRFLQQHSELEKTLRTLLEYEWTLFFAEIDPSQVEASTFEDIPDQDSEDLSFTLRLNPTLQLIELPFLVTDDMISSGSSFSACPIEHGTFYYAIFRNLDNQVLCKSLSLVERYLLDCLKEPNKNAYEALRVHLEPWMPSLTLQKQLSYFKTIHLISIHLKR